MVRDWGVQHEDRMRRENLQMRALNLPEVPTFSALIYFRQAALECRVQRGKEAMHVGVALLTFDS